MTTYYVSYTFQIYILNESVTVSDSFITELNEPITEKFIKEDLVKKARELNVEKGKDADCDIVIMGIIKLEK